MVIATGQLSRRHTLLLLLQQGGPPPPLSPRSHSPPSSDVAERAGRDGAAIASPRFIASPTPRRLDLSRQGVSRREARKAEDDISLGQNFHLDLGGGSGCAYGFNLFRYEVNVVTPDLETRSEDAVCFIKVGPLKTNCMILRNTGFNLLLAAAAR